MGAAREVVLSSRGPARAAPGRRALVERLIRQIAGIRSQIDRLERRHPVGVRGPHTLSVRNLLDYLAFRCFDVRSLQDDLAELGLSSLGRAESHVRYNLDAVLRALYELDGRTPPELGGHDRPDPVEGRRRIEANAERLLGPPRSGRRTRIMVTMPTEAAADPALVPALLEAGMDCMRINCAHDSPAVWAEMIARLRSAEASTGERCRVEMDLSGPRVRTGELPPLPGVIKVRPRRDRFGRVEAPGSLWLVPADTAPPGPERAPCARVDRAAFDRLRRGARIRVRDARDARRELTVAERRPNAARLETRRTVYLTDGLTLDLPGRSGRGRAAATIAVAPEPGLLRVKIGDTVRLETRRSSGGRPDRVPILPPEALDPVAPGASIWFDDGRIGGVVRSRSGSGASVRITHAAPNGSKLGSEKGINLPDSRLRLPAMTAEDERLLDFVAANADILGCSFVQGPDDVGRIRSALAHQGAGEMPLVLKIETALAFEQLPAILFSALEAPSAGVMIARGDLAVEVGYERLAEVQEEMLWLCEAAHLPSVWATQVLEALTRTGRPSRAEVTDAAMGERAECVMLNKGPHLVEAVRALDNILRRMEDHQAKKSPRLRHLNVAEAFFRSGGG